MNNDKTKNSEQTVLNENDKDKTRLSKANDKERDGCRWKDGEIANELKYTDYNHLPMADNNNNYEYGYSFLPPEKWYPQPPFPPVCVTNVKSPIVPVFTTGSPVDVKEWNSTLRITPPDNINVAYIKEKLNSGR